MLPTKQALQKLANDVHGSGINYDWHLEETKNSFRLSNRYDTMDENGFYDSPADFVLIFPKDKHMIDFKLQFGGKLGQYLNQKYMLRSYLEDMFAEYINEQNWGK